MVSRRGFLLSGLPIGLTGVSGCLDRRESVRGTQQESVRFLGLADPRSHVPPNFHTMYRLAVSDVVDTLGADVTFPVEAGEFKNAVANSVPETTADDIETIVGQRFRGIGTPHSDLDGIVPHGNSLSVTGGFTEEHLKEWLDGTMAERIPSDGEQIWYGTDMIDGARGYAIGDGELTMGFLRGPTDIAPETLAMAGETADDDAWIGSASPALTRAVNALHSAPYLVATEYDVISENPNTGNPHADALCASLQATALAIDPGDQLSTVTFALQYRNGAAPEDSSVRSGFEDGMLERTAPLFDSFTVDRDGSIVLVSGEVATDRVREGLSGVPAPGYNNMFEPVVLEELGRNPPPSVRFAIDWNEDHVMIHHEAGLSVSDLSIEYYVNNSQHIEEWTGQITPGESYRIERNSGQVTQLRIIWRRGTADSTILYSTENH